MNVALVRQRYTAFGGAERFLDALMSGLGETQIELSLLCRSWSGALRENMQVKRFDPFYIGRVWREMSFARAIQREISTGRYDLVQSHERIAGCDIFRAGDGTHRGWLEHRARRRGTTLWRAMLDPYNRYTLKMEGEMFAHPRLRAVICNSRLIQREISQLYGVPESRLALIHNGVDLDRYHPPSEQERTHARAQFALGRDQFVMLFIGSGFERKGLDALLNVLPPEVQLLVVGKDQREPSYQALASRLGQSDRVQFFGPRHDVLPFYHAADAFVFPAIYEPFGNVVLEAFATGLPALTSQQCGSEEYVKHGVNGWLVDAFDQDELRQCLKEIPVVLADPNRRASMQSAARASAEHFTSAAMVDRLVALYRSLSS